MSATAGSEATSAPPDAATNSQTPALPTSAVGVPGGPIPAEDAAEYRAYLQRGETRLSTFHRVAGSFISGAGLLTLLPVLINQAFSGLLAAMVFVSMPGLPEAGGWQRWLALVPVLASIALPLIALYLLIRELTVFYFTARSFRQDSSKRQYPRFILSGILVSTENISERDRLEVERKRDTVRDLVVPNTEPLLRRLLKEAQAQGQLTHFTTATEYQDVLRTELKNFILDQTGSDPRSLPEESAKMEVSIARHQQYLRSLVLRYSKAFLLTIATTVITVTASGALSLLTNPYTRGTINPAHTWFGVLILYSIWCCVSAFLVRRPVGWIYRDVPTNEGKRTPQSLLLFERRTLATIVVMQIILAIEMVIFSPALEPSWQLLPWVFAVLALGFVVTYFVLTLRIEIYSDRARSTP